VFQFMVAVSEQVMPVYKRSRSGDKLLLCNTIRFNLDNNNDDKNKRHAVVYEDDANRTREALYLRLAIAEALRSLFPVTLSSNSRTFDGWSLDISDRKQSFCHTRIVIQNMV
jgi:hypothetical protein